MFSLCSERTPESMGVRALPAIGEVLGADAVNLKRINSVNSGEMRSRTLLFALIQLIERLGTVVRTISRLTSAMTRVQI